MKKLLRFIFSGYFLSFVMILIEIAVLFVLVVRLSAFSVIFFVGVVVVNAISLVVVINKEGSPERKLTWMAVILLLPILGTLLFLLFRTRGVSKREVKRGEQIISEMAQWSYPRENLAELEACDREAYCRARVLLCSSATAGLYKDTDSRFYASGEQMYSAMLSDLASAKKYILLEYFIVEDGEMWQGIRDILASKTREGVEVRMLVDDIGCMGKIDAGFIKNVEAIGVSILRFSRFTPRFSAKHNNRDHRKLLVIDGVIGYTGGVNIADEYINRVVRFGHWKDGGVRLCGGAVLELVRMFLAMWDMTSGGRSDYAFFLDNVHIPTPVSEKCGYVLPFGCGPEPLYKRQTGMRALLDIIERAKTYVYITTPYLIIDNDMTEALYGAALRGVDVRIITPGIADKRLIKLIGKGYYLGLVRSGVKIYEYSPGFIHEKLVVSDDSYALVGTINLDYRSLVHHYEDAVIIYGSDTVLDIRDAYLETIEKSLPIDESRAHLHALGRIFCSLMHLFAPLL